MSLSEAIGKFWHRATDAQKLRLAQLLARRAEMGGPPITLEFVGSTDGRIAEGASGSGCLVKGWRQSSRKLSKE
jgi:hypothetical protein